MNTDLQKYNGNLNLVDQKICDTLANIIDKNLPDAVSKVWHRHPVWFLDGNPVVGYAKQKSSVVLLFWSGQSFEEEILKCTGSFKMGKIELIEFDQINLEDLERLLSKSRLIQWDYKNIVKRKGKLIKLTEF